MSIAEKSPRHDMQSDLDMSPNKETFQSQSG